MNHNTPKQLVFLALLATISSLGRILFSGIPNVQPVTALLIIFTLILGLKEGLIIATLTMLLSNFLLGMGPWTFMQIGSYWLIIVIAYWLHHLCISWQQRNKYILFAIYSGIAGLLYGLSISIMWVILLRINHFWAYYLRGIPFDIAHAIGNVCFFLILAPMIQKIFNQYYPSKVI